MKNKARDKDDLLRFVEEPVAIYGQKKEGSLVSLLEDKFRMVELIQRGISYKFFDKLRAVFPFSMQEWSSFLDISLKSLHRYQQESRTFKPIHSEKILELAEVVTYGMQVFESSDNFKIWLGTPSLALGHKKPIDLVKNSYGKELVMRELVAIEYGVFA